MHQASAESVERIPYHRHEELFTFTDGSKLLYDHVEEKGAVVFDDL